MSEKPEHPWPPLYATLWPRFVVLAREHGYALGVHGSLDRDMDLIAVPWTETASAPEDLVRALNEWVSPFVEKEQALSGPEAKPHGRMAWNITLGGGAFVDLSIMPRLRPGGSADSLGGMNPTSRRSSLFLALACLALLSAFLAGPAAAQITWESTSTRVHTTQVFAMSMADDAPSATTDVDLPCLPASLIGTAHNVVLRVHVHEDPLDGVAPFDVAHGYLPADGVVPAAQPEVVYHENLLPWPATFDGYMSHRLQLRSGERLWTPSGVRRAGRELWSIQELAPFSCTQQDLTSGPGDGVIDWQGPSGWTSDLRRPDLESYGFVACTGSEWATTFPRELFEQDLDGDGCITPGVDRTTFKAHLRTFLDSRYTSFVALTPDGPLDLTLGSHGWTYQLCQKDRPVDVYLGWN